MPMFSSFKKNACLLSLMLATPAFAESYVLDYGVVQRISGGVVEVNIPGDLVPDRFPSDIDVVATLDELKLKRDLSFGLVWVIDDVRPDKSGYADVELTVSHPEMQLPAGNLSRGIVKNFRSRVVKGRVYGVAAYALTAPYKLVAGKWSFTVSIDKQTLSKDFMLKWN